MAFQKSCIGLMQKYVRKILKGFPKSYERPRNQTYM